ncbi:MAG TPA: phosphodiester glycosidase family protein [Miltoncostaea sp.]|nr:phosphodiester glycosidase family protein [Miltoncostaea sp.]
MIHVVRAPASPRVRLAPVLAGGSLLTRGSLTGAVAAREHLGAVAGINGDFFTYGTNDPSGVLIIGGELLHEPEASRSALTLGPASDVGVPVLALQGRVQAADPTTGALSPPRTFQGLNRPAKRGTETILYTPGYGALNTPVGGSRYEVRVRLDQAGPLLPNVARTGTVVGTKSGGGSTIGAGHWVLTGVGAAGPTLVSEYPLGEKVTITAAVPALPAGTTDAIGGGPVLVRGGVAVPDAGEGFTGSQTDDRTARSAVGQTADGTLLFVTVEGPSQGRPGMTAADQAGLMKSLGARDAVAMDSGGSAQLAVRDALVIPWSSVRSLSDVVVMSYRGVTIEPLPFRISPNADRVDDAPTTTVRSPVAGTAAVKIIRRSGRPSKQVWRGRLSASSARVNINPRRLGLPDGVYDVRVRQLPDDGSGVTEQSRRVIVDRTLGSLSATQTVVKAGRRRQARLTVGFRLSRPARATVRIRTTGGDPVATIASGRPLRAGRQSVNWNRRVRGRVVTGTVDVTVEARGPLGTSGLVREVKLITPPKPPKPRPRPRPSTP